MVTSSPFGFCLQILACPLTLPCTNAAADQHEADPFSDKGTTLSPSSSCSGRLQAAVRKLQSREAKTCATIDMSKWCTSPCCLRPLLPLACRVLHSATP